MSIDHEASALEPTSGHQAACFTRRGSGRVSGAHPSGEVPPSVAPEEGPPEEEPSRIAPDPKVPLSAEKIVAGLKEVGLFAIVETVCRRHHVLPIEVCGRGRTKNVAKARHAVWWELRHRPESSFSYPELARLFDRDHSTIISAMRGLELAKTIGKRSDTETQAA